MAHLLNVYLCLVKTIIGIQICIIDKNKNKIM